MPDQAFSKISSLAGPEIPARHQTLNQILILLLTPRVDQHTLAQAIASEPRLLIQFLSANEIEHWITGVDLFVEPVVCLERVLVLANQMRTDESAEAWQRSRLAALLAESLAKAANYPTKEIQRCKLLASLLDIGHEQLSDQTFHLPREEQLAMERNQFGEVGSELGARLLARRGFVAQDCDVLRFQYEGLDVLQEAPADLLLVALAGRLADAMLTDFELAESYFELIDNRLGLDGSQLRNILEQTFNGFRADNDQLVSLKNYEDNLAQANLAQRIRLCQSQDVLAQIGQQVFGFEQIIFAIPDQGALFIDVLGEVFSVAAANGNSEITRAYQAQKVFSAEENALVAIVDRQILSRLAAGALWFLPFGSEGVAICSRGQSLFAPDEFLLAEYTKACCTVLANTTLASDDMIEVDQVQRRVRELTHEVNNPLAIVQNYLKTLSLKLGPDSTAQPDIETISREMLRIGGIIQKYAEIGSETSETLQLVDLNGLLQSMTGVFQGSHPNITFQLDVDPGVPQVMANADLLKQVVVNLLKNAAEALEQTNQAQVSLATNAKVNLGGQHYVEVLIQDNGPGIPGEIYQHLFESNNSSKGVGHSGLGLSVANRLVTEMAGILGCKTSATAGTQFQILLPIEQQSDHFDQRANQPSQRKKGTP